MHTIIKGVKYNCFRIFDDKDEAFKYSKTIANNTSVYKTDNNKYALFIRAKDVTNIY